jgi:hypothetical protein
VAILDVTLLLQESALYNNTVKRSEYATVLLKKLCTFYANQRVITVFRKKTCKIQGKDLRMTNVR